MSNSNDVEMKDDQPLQPPPKDDDSPAEEKKEKTEFHLSRIIPAHKSDVKSVFATAQGTIISGSRDETVKLWVERKGTYYSTVEFPQHGKLVVNSVAFYQSDSGDWLLFVGRKDGTISVYNAATHEPCSILREHKTNVCVLYIDSVNKVLMSGSWDHQALVWPIERIISGVDHEPMSLSGHKNSVWAVTSFTNKLHLYLTGSADRTIRLWEKDRTTKTFEGHEDVVRALVVLTDNTFISAANDSTLRIWDIDKGTCLQKYASLTSEYIYSLNKVHLRNCEQYIVNSTEKGYLEFWRLEVNGLQPHQLIRTPAGSLWSVASTKSGEVVVGGSNGLIYVFTSIKERMADAAVLEVFDAEVAQMVAMELNLKENQANEVVNIKVALDDGAPNLNLKYEKGSDPTDAAEQFIRENNIPYSYLNEIVEYIKLNVPEARIAEAAKYKKQPTQRVEVDGKKYDYSFDVQSDDGQSFKLNYNIGEDPEITAQQLVEKHNLPIKYLKPFSKFLRAQVPELSENFSSVVSDPFTGGGRYVPSQTANGTGSNFADPFTGGGRYVPGSGGTEIVNTLGPLDKKRPRSDLVPLQKYFSFGYEGSSAKALEKLMENNQMQEDFLLEDELAALTEIFKSEEYAVTDAHVSALEKGLNWTIESITPLLDVFRLALLNPSLNNVFCSLNEGNGLKILARLTNLLISEPTDPVRILVCRAFTNAALHPSGREMLRRDFTTHMNLLVDQLQNLKPAIQLAATSALANLSLILLQETEQGDVMELGPREDVLRAVIQETEKIENFGDYSKPTLIRLMQTIATLMWGDSAVIKLAKDRDVQKIVNKIRDAVSEESGKRLALDILGMIWAV